MKKPYIGRYTQCAKAVALTALTVLSFDAFAAQNWPGESWEKALELGGLEDSFSDGDISGAHWNNNTQTLWLSDNKEEMIWSLVETTSGFKVDKSFDAKGDLEGITQAMDDEVLYLMDEDRYIRSYNANSGDSITTWSIEDGLPSSGDKGKDGPEGITFVPDTWLSQSGFVDENGNAYKASKYDFGGIFLVAHQNGGSVYAFDLASDGSFDFIGQYDTAQEESSGLAFDRSTGILYISHNIGDNTLETTNLESTANDGHREFVTGTEFEAPNDSNLEGFAIKPALNDDNTANDVWAFYADDNGNTSDGNAILVFKELASTLTVTSGNNQVAAAGDAVSMTPTVNLQDAFNNALSGVDVNFTVNEGSGSIIGGDTFTNSNGLAELESWTLGETGDQQLLVNAATLSTVINASITSDDTTEESNNPEEENETEEGTTSATDITATSSGDDADNVAENVLDDKPSTRWSASGEQWLQLDLGATQTITGVSFAFYKGDTRSAIFDIETSIDGENWNVQLDGYYSLGNSDEAESFYFNSNVDAQYVRYIGYGNDSSKSSTAKWNSITEAKVLVTSEGDTDNNDDVEGDAEVVNSAITLQSVSSFSSEQSKNEAENLFDGDTSDTSGKRWSAEGLQTSPQWVVIDMGASYEISLVTVYPFSDRAYQYQVEISEEADGNFTTIVDRTDNSKNSSSIADVVENTTTGRYLRLEVQGADDYSGDWVSINEIKVEGHQQ